MEKKNDYRVGILGGMGPMAGVALQKLIIEHTPAKKDQDHIQVVCFTNPHIPDRTKSLQENDGHAYADAIIDSIKVLENAGAHAVLLPCNTSHARLEKIQASTKLPIVNMVELALDTLRQSKVKKFGLLATDGTIASRVFEGNTGLQVILPDAKTQKSIMEAIYEIKSGKYSDETILKTINTAVKNLRTLGAEKIILGCTELSLYFPMLKSDYVIDPLVEVARTVVKTATAV